MRGEKRRRIRKLEKNGGDRHGTVFLSYAEVRQILDGTVIEKELPSGWILTLSKPIDRAEEIELTKRLIYGIRHTVITDNEAAGIIDNRQGMKGDLVTAKKTSTGYTVDLPDFLHGGEIEFPEIGTINFSADVKRTPAEQEAHEQHIERELSEMFPDLPEGAV